MLDKEVNRINPRAKDKKPQDGVVGDVEGGARRRQWDFTIKAKAEGYRRLIEGEQVGARGVFS